MRQTNVTENEPEISHYLWRECISFSSKWM